MYDNTELRILQEIYTNPGIHKREISKRLDIGMPSIEAGQKKIEGVLRFERFGNQIRSFVDYTKQKVIPFLYMVEYSRLEKSGLFELKNTINSLKYFPLIHLILKEGKNVESILVFQSLNEDIEKNCRKVFVKKGKISLFDFAEFKRRFHDQSDSYFKDMKKRKIVASGLEWYCMLESEEA